MAAGDNRQRPVAAQFAGQLVLLLVVVADGAEQQQLLFAARVPGLAGHQLTRAQERYRTKNRPRRTVAQRQDKRGVAGIGHHRRIQEGENVSRLVEGGNRIVVSRQHHQPAAGLLQLNDKAVIQLARVARR